MELSQLRYFRAIVQHGHMTRAARALGVTQPALSAMLKKLEKEVGASLMHRKGRGLELSEAGRVFLVHAEDAIRQAEMGVTAVRDLLGLKRGSIRVGGGATATTYLLPSVVRTVRQAHPGLRFYVREAGSNAVASAVASGELDVGIVTLPGASGRGSRQVGVDQAMLTMTPWLDDELRLIVPPGHTLTSTRQFRWKDLVGEPIVAFEAGTAVREIVDQASLSAGVALGVVMELRSIESIKQMVAAGVGVGFVSRFALAADASALVCRESKLTRTLAIATRADRPMAPAVGEFVRALMAHI